MSGIRAGDVLAGRFRIVRELGRGGMGVVYEAVQLGLERRVAVKMLRPEREASARFLERLAREAKAAGCIVHPNVAATTELVCLPDQPAFIVMEHIDARSLEDILERDGVLEPSRVAFLGSQLLSGLEAAHRCGVVHRDLKPSNVLVAAHRGTPELVKIVDFGIAKLVDEERHARLTRTGVLMGTPGYLSPEQARGGRVDGRSDVFGAGVMLYRMLTGRLPWAAKDPMSLLVAVLNEPPLPLSIAMPALHPAFGAVIDRALARDPDARFANAGEMRDALGKFISVGHAEALRSLEMGVVASMPPPPTEVELADDWSRTVPSTIAEPPPPTRSDEEASGGILAPPVRARSRAGMGPGAIAALVAGALLAGMAVFGAIVVVALPVARSAPTPSRVLPVAPAAPLADVTRAEPRPIVPVPAPPPVEAVLPVAPSPDVPLADARGHTRARRRLSSAHAEETGSADPRPGVVSAEIVVGASGPVTSEARSARRSRATLLELESGGADSYLLQTLIRSRTSIIASCFDSTMVISVSIRASMVHSRMAISEVRFADHQVDFTTQDCVRRALHGLVIETSNPADISGVALILVE